ncbi:MAG: peptidylprolyl isomerase [Verrucomicrobiota bacterium]
MAASKLLPVLNTPIADRSGLAGTPFTVNLNSAFGTEAIDANVVRFTSSNFSIGGVPVFVDMALFSNRAPVTRTNFLKYVADGDYVNSFIHRSVAGFVIQGGGFRINATTNNIEYVPTDPPIVNEFGVSNTLGTISMAKTGAGPDSATSQWFVSLGANSANLDAQNGGFTVFGRITKSTLSTAQTFGNPSVFPVYDYGSPFDQLPLFYTHTTDLLISEMILFTGVSLVPLPAGEAGEDPALTYSVVSSSNPTVGTAAIQAGGLLGVSPVAGQSGTTVVTVRATDTVGNTVDSNFTLTVNLTDTFTTWVSRNSFSGAQSGASQDPDGDGWNNLQEFAFLGDPATPDPTGQVVFPGMVGTAPTKYLTLTFPVRKSTQGLTYIVEGNDGLSGTWTEIWNSANGFLHAQVVSAVDQSDRTVVTVKDTSVIGVQPKRFLRTRVVQQ